MIVRYRVSCECGQFVSVSDAQSGSEVACPCGKSVAIPMLRDLRRLPVDETARPDPADAVQRPWNQRQLVLSGIGFVTLFALALAGIFAIGSSRLDTSWSPEAQRKADDELIDSIELAETMGAWLELKTGGLGEPMPTNLMLNVATKKQLGQLIAYSLAAAGVGAVAWGLAAATIKSS